MKKNSKIVGIVLGIIAAMLIIAFLIPPVAKGLRAVWRWGFDDEPLVWKKSNNEIPDLKIEVSAEANASASCNGNDCTAKDTVEETIASGDPCLTTAKSFGIPDDMADYICTMPQNNPNAPEQMDSKEKITFGSITFDSETRVWVLRNFIVPSAANYSFDHSGRERRILGAGFYTGAALSPVNDLPFVVCYDTTSEGCIPPHNIQFFD